MVTQIFHSRHPPLFIVDYRPNICQVSTSTSTEIAGTALTFRHGLQRAIDLEFSGEQKIKREPLHERGQHLSRRCIVPAGGCSNCIICVSEFGYRLCCPNPLIQASRCMLTIATNNSAVKFSEPTGKLLARPPGLSLRSEGRYESCRVPRALGLH